MAPTLLDGIARQWVMFVNGTTPLDGIARQWVMFA
jgi:hypothetical protein